MRSIVSLVLVLTVETALPALAAEVEPGEPVVSEIVVDAPIQDVWAAFTTREGIRSWVAATFGDRELRLGAVWLSSYVLDSKLDDDSVIRTELLAFDPGRMMAARILKAPGDFPFPNAVLTTWYITYLEPIGDAQTRVVHRMFGFTEDEESQQMRAFFERGNQYELEQLARHFARGEP